MRSFAIRLLLCAWCCGLASAACGDSRVPLGLADMLSAVPVFMHGAVDSLCSKAAPIAADKMPGTDAYGASCKAITAELREAKGCLEPSTVFWSAAHLGDCHCRAAIAFADAIEHHVRADMLAEQAPVARSATAAGGGVLVVVAAVAAAALAALATHRRKHARLGFDALL